VTIQIEAIEQYFHVVLLIMLYKVLLTFKNEDGTQHTTFQKKTNEQYFQMHVDFSPLNIEMWDYFNWSILGLES